jgi:hypothetical protein
VNSGGERKQSNQILEKQIGIPNGMSNFFSVLAISSRESGLVAICMEKQN